MDVQEDELARLALEHDAAGGPDDRSVLLGAATLTAWWSSTPEPDHQVDPTRRDRGIIVAAGVAMLVLGISGAIAALGDTLFPVDTFAEGLERELSATGHVFERLRIFHPAFAIGGGLLAIWAATQLAESRRGRVGRLSRLVTLLVFAQIGLGTVNALLAAPIWIQVVHLLLADLVWMTLVVLGADVLVRQRSEVPA